ncbi:polymer-forming cytoskeletal protein [Candidatus Parcubacteria bacterium]|jgi:cytoskeletal protein CcmA (bactofilin family)|nr:MAG: polymer-forming cytoskeletal protein [Candidatus Parcubacteria bacterium]
MAIFKQEMSNSKQNETIIGSSVKVEGTFVGEGNVIIEGQLQGNLKTKHNINVGPSAKLKANIEGQDVYIAGTLHGNVKALGKLQMTSTAKIVGNVEAAALNVETGAILNGKCNMLAETTLPEKPEKK